MFYVRRVAGNSMLPGLRPGRLVLAVRTRRLRPGDVLIVRRGNEEHIKRLACIEANRLFVLGDNPDASTDSRDFGWLDQSAVIGKVWWPRLRQ